MTKKQLLNPQRMFYIMIGTVVITSGLAGGSVILGSSFLQKQSSKLVSLKLQYRVPEENRTALKRAKSDIEKYSELGKTAKAVVPQEKDQARTVREIVNYANQTVDPVTKNNIHILSISFPGSNLGQAAVIIPKAPSTDSKTPEPTTPKVVTPPVSQVLAVEGIQGVYILPITVESDPATPLTFNQVVSFLGKLEQNRRTAQVSQISITPQKTTGLSGLSFTLTINVYIKP